MCVCAKNSRFFDVVRSGQFSALGRSVFGDKESTGVGVLLFVLHWLFFPLCGCVALDDSSPPTCNTASIDVHRGATKNASWVNAS